MQTQNQMDNYLDQYTVEATFDMPETMEKKLKEELSNKYISIYTPIYAFYDYETNKLVKREIAIESPKKVVSSYFQFYYLTQTKTHLVITRKEAEYQINFNSKTNVLNINFKVDEKVAYSYYTALPGTNNLSYFYNEKSKRKLLTENKFFAWSESNIIMIDDSVLESDLIQRTSFDKLLRTVLEEKHASTSALCSNLLNCMKYFDYRKKYPEVDNLIQKDLPYVLSLIESNANLYNYFFKGNSFKKNFILPKGCLEVIIEHFCKDNYRYYNILGLFNQMHFHTKNVTKELIEEIYQLYTRGGGGYDYGYSFVNSLKTVVVDHNIPIKQVIAYLTRVDDYQALYPSEGIIIWKDYLQSAKQMGLDDFDKYPNSLKREHDIFARESIRVANEQEDAYFKEAMNKYQGLTYEDDTYCIVVPESSEDLRLEGRALSHCVGTYVSRVAERKTTIFFVRDKKKKDTSLYTLEVCNGAMVQFKGKFNCQPSKDAKAFAETFIEECINKHYDQGEVASLAM